MTNMWMAKSVEAISASTGCAIEAAPAPQEIGTLPPALVRMASSAPGGAPLVPMATGRPQLSLQLLQQCLRWPRTWAEAARHRRTRAGVAGDVARAQPQQPRRQSSQQPALLLARRPSRRRDTSGHRRHQEMDGLDEDEELYFEQAAVVEHDAEDGQTRSHGTSEVMKCLYTNLLDNAKPTKVQAAAEDGRERTPAEAEADGQRLKEQLLTMAPSSQDFW